MLTRRGALPAGLEEAVPRGGLEALVAPFYAEGSAGRPPVPLAVTLRMYIASAVYDLSDGACQDECNDSAAVRPFVGLGERDAPDETTLCKFRRPLEENGLGEAMPAEVNAALAECGAAVSRGAIVDAAFAESPPSAENGEGACDPGAHQVKKGSNRHFGCKAHMGAAFALANLVLARRAPGRCAPPPAA